MRLGSRAIRLLPRGRYPLMNFLCRKPITPFVRELGVVDGRVKFFCDPRDGIAREACFMGHYEPQETAIMLHVLRPGMCFVDVGANWGYFTLLAADLVGKDGRVVSFEPHPLLFAQLQENLLRNALTWAAALQVAVADTFGEMTLASFDTETSNWGVSHLVAECDPQAPQFRVQSGLLETLLDRHGVSSVDMLKMDIEGAESFVLPTLQEGLISGRYKRVLLELHPRALEEAGVSPQSLLLLLLDCGYRGWTIDHSRSAFRRAAYSLPTSPAQFLMPIDPDRAVDEWPHALFLAPGVDATW